MFVKYFERGYVPIPVFKAGKNPAIMNWSRWCREKPSANQIEEWESKFVDCNIGITCGPASGIIVVDIDVDDNDFKNLCPPSTVIRRGAKGEARVFKWREGITSQSMPGLDILSDGRQFLVPPSIHPSTKKPYVWLTKDTLDNTDPSDLPELDISFLEKIQKTKIAINTKPGRNNKLVDIVSAMRGRGEPEAKIVDEIYQWDLNHHTPRLFTDLAEGFRANNEDQARTNAWSFVTSVTKSLIDSGKFMAVQDATLTVQVTDEQEQLIVEKYKVREYPEPTGLIKDIRDLIVDYSERAMPNIALGGAVALMAAVCSNRFRFKQTWSNMYVLNLAPTGAGKSFPQRIISIILNERLGSDLMGFGSYHSFSALGKNLVSKRERLDMIDEISSLFSSIKDGGLWQTSLLEELCKLWSSSNGKYMAAEYAKEESTSSCFNPCVTILGSSTIEGIKSTMTKAMTNKGLIPRFMIFSHENYGRLKEDFLNEPLLGSVVEQIRSILSVKRRELDTQTDITAGPIYNPYDLAPTEKSTQDYFRALRVDYANRVEAEPYGPFKDMLTRATEQIMRLSIQHAAGNSRTITTADIDWARGVYEVSLHNSKGLILETAVDNDWEKDLEIISNLIKKNGSISQKAITRNMKRPPARMDALLKHLDQSGNVIRFLNRKKEPALMWTE